MRNARRSTLLAVAAFVAAAALLAPASLAQESSSGFPYFLASEPYLVTFDNGPEGWNFTKSNCAALHSDGGNPGAYMNFSGICGTTYNLSGWFEFFHEIPADAQSLGDAPAVGARISVDIDVVRYDFWLWGIWLPVEQWRDFVVEIRDYDNPYTDPETGYSWPWTSVWYVAGALPSRDAGWQTFTIEIPDLAATEMPDGWYGFGGPEDPNTYKPQLPPNRDFASVIAGADEIRFTSARLDTFYSFDFLHDINVDNIRIEMLQPMCGNKVATVYVDTDGIVRGGAYDGEIYQGILEGTDGDDVIVGTAGDDIINGSTGNDMLCGVAGNDTLDGGDGMDLIDGGAGENSCSGGEIVSRCR